MLGACFAAFGNDVAPVGMLLVAYIIGQLGSLIPIPGGAGAVDAGLIGTVVLYGVDATAAAVADRLGKEGVDGSSPSDGFRELPLFGEVFLALDG